MEDKKFHTRPIRHTFIFLSLWNLKFISQSIIFTCGKHNLNNASNVCVLGFIYILIFMGCMQWVGLKYTLMEGTDREVHEVPKLIEIMEKFEIIFWWNIQYINKYTTAANFRLIHIKRNVLSYLMSIMSILNWSDFKTIKDGNAWLQNASIWITKCIVNYA